MTIKKMIDGALAAKKLSYSPYSRFRVGACVRCEDDSLYTGSNIENAAYSATICAERVAIYKAVSEGHREIKEIVIVGDDDFTYPCGECRQVLSEFGKKTRIYVAKNAEEYREYSLEELLPHSFSESSLERK